MKEWIALNHLIIITAITRLTITINLINCWITLKKIFKNENFKYKILSIYTYSKCEPLSGNEYILVANGLDGWYEHGCRYK